MCQARNGKASSFDSAPRLVKSPVFTGICCDSGVRVSPETSPVWLPVQKLASARIPLAHCSPTRKVPMASHSYRVDWSLLACGPIHQPEDRRGGLGQEHRQRFGRFHSRPASWNQWIFSLKSLADAAIPRHLCLPAKTRTTGARIELDANGNTMSCCRSRSNTSNWISMTA